ncbi:hypothetical protein N326_09177, partial [Eurypyga helias]
RSSPAALHASCNELSRGAGHSHPYVQQESTLTWHLEASCSGAGENSILFPYLAPEKQQLSPPSLREKPHCHPSQKSKLPEPGRFPFWECSA